ncbi:unnamed protein product [Protopolystoma xenopodis]|uniref:Uncharacterized protein n=1 Tax=Protopolystoma xenopodis TaxID=117903 RepID=A0A448WWQ1_9PLAT|nr:unnamed protein product [Protopolystoma xenopodis]
MTQSTGYPTLLTPGRETVSRMTSSSDDVHQRLNECSARFHPKYTLWRLDRETEEAAATDSDRRWSCQPLTCKQVSRLPLEPGRREAAVRPDGVGQSVGVGARAPMANQAGLGVAGHAGGGEHVNEALEKRGNRLNGLSTIENGQNDGKDGRD